KSGIENLSGISMNDVNVHYNSSQPAQLNAHAYAQGTDIHLASGQEKHLPHEAWHVVQQKQGRVKPTMQMKGKVNVNDDKGLEKEADVMGAKALQMKSAQQSVSINSGNTKSIQNSQVAQLVRATNRTGMVLDAVFDDGKVSLTEGDKEIGYVTYSPIGRGIISQEYIKVNETHSRLGISYLLTYLSVSQGGFSLLYLGGGSLSPSGALLANKLGFKNYAPKKGGEEESGGGFWSCFCCCFGKKKTGESAPLLEGGNTELLNIAYKTQMDLAGGEIPPIKWLEVETLQARALEKVKEYGWAIS
ncbi:MAG TPA: DUF4157 domain-containing protein, partial [Bacteroidia bacterium]|nr:DUF4157 domain-containing protein [Bacteroidia bacterium]